MENWIIIPSAPDYEISDFGRVRRLKPAKRTSAGRIRKTYLSPKGYSYTSLRVAGKVRGFQVHRLVMLAFRGPSDLQVNHINGVKHDNRLDNLEYLTPSANTLHARDALGALTQGTKHHAAKLDEDKVRAIRQRSAAGETTVAIAKDFGVSSTLIGYVVRRKWWKQVK